MKSSVERFTLIDTKNDRVISSGHSHNRLFHISYNLTQALMEEYIDAHIDDFNQVEFDAIIFRYQIKIEWK